ncbi:unnamed protein product [Polarella glacialis]|uniref:Uncharacterized protein n=1 Tax=Polarella glacialis TaxID=89957 RepID=A0A813GH35_POLGL|nr:unnamed protein product [Polarella glacialis]CAE8657898.1 unnamed protein product [Polarella glacialis]
MKSLSTAVELEADWKVLNGLLPLGRDALSAEVREKLFKELVVRSDHIKEVITKKGSARHMRGTVSKADLVRYLSEALVRNKALLCDSYSMVEIQHSVECAFRAARGWIEPVTPLDQKHIDMNEWHTLVLYLVNRLDLWETVRRECGVPEDYQAHSGSWQLAESQLRALLEQLTAKSSCRRHGEELPETLLEELKLWASQPSRVFQRLADAPGQEYLSFDVFVDWYVFSHMPSWSAEEILGRKRAFQLLQVLNNTPSLPNSIPGPLGTPRVVSGGGGPGGQASPGGGATPRMQAPAAVWMSTHQRFFPDRSPRPGQVDALLRLAPAPVSTFSKAGLDRGVRPPTSSWVTEAKTGMVAGRKYHRTQVPLIDGLKITNSVMSESFTVP